MKSFTADRMRQPLLLAACCAVVAFAGCSRRTYHVQADRQVYNVIEEHNQNPRWAIRNYAIEMDPRSRYFENEDQDCPPMPQDDPVSHQYMESVNGIPGWKKWNDFGQRAELENPGWREKLREYVEVGEDGSFKLDLDKSLELAYIHSPRLQSQLETLYLSSIDVTTERFRLDTQFFGGFDTAYRHTGNRSPGGESNTLTVGRGAGALAVAGRQESGTLIQVNRRLATAGELLFGVANSFMWEFTQGDINFASSTLNASFIQPLLRGAGKDVGLEQLTIVERALLGNVRAFHRYRKGFYTQVAIGGGVGGLQRRGGFFGGTGLTGFSGQGAGGFGGVGGGTFGGGGFGGGGGNGGTGTGFAGGGAGTVGGYIGLLQQLQQIRNSQDSLNLQLRTLSLLEAHLAAGVIDLTQVDQFRQSIETERATLLQTKNGLDFALESFKTGTLGLPPDIPMQLDDSMIRQFQLVAPKATSIQDEIARMQDTVGELPDMVSLADVRKALMSLGQLVVRLRGQLADVAVDVDKMETATAGREKSMVEVEKKMFARDRQQVREGLATLNQQFNKAAKDLKMLADGLNENSKQDTVKQVVVWLSEMYRIAQSSILTQARAKLEAVTISTVQINSDDAFRIALENRLDWMNARASLVDSWRLIAFNADALQANVSVAFSGDMSTTRDNALSFNGHDSTFRAGLKFDGPFTRLLERNNYRQSLIDYQSARRNYIQSRDGLHQGLRASIRNLEQLRTNLEIQRRAVAISIRRVDMTRETLSQPVPPPLPGQPAAQFGPTAATNLLTALSDLRNAQNNFMSVWLNYYAARMTLERELGLMELDEKGRWIDRSVQALQEGMAAGQPSGQVPPSVPAEWMEMADQMPEQIRVPQYDPNRYPMNLNQSGAIRPRQNNSNDPLPAQQRTRSQTSIAGRPQPTSGVHQPTLPPLTPPPRSPIPPPPPPASLQMPVISN